jgi:hypothetical protein
MKLPPRIAREVYRPPPRKRPGDSRAHLKWIATLPCLVTGITPCGDAHHLLGNMDGLPKGMSRKNEDRWAIPVTNQIHREAHAAGDDEAYFRARGFDVRAIASALWRVSGDDEAARRIIFRARQAA